MEQWVLTVYKLTDTDRNSSPRLINEAVTASILGSFCHGEADVVQRTSDSHVYCNTARPTCFIKMTRGRLNGERRKSAISKRKFLQKMDQTKFQCYLLIAGEEERSVHELCPKTHKSF